MMALKIGERALCPEQTIKAVCGTIREIHQTYAGPVAAVESDDGKVRVVELKKLSSAKPITPVLPPEKSSSDVHWLKNKDGSRFPFEWDIWFDKWQSYNFTMTPQMAAAMGWEYDCECPFPEKDCAK